MKRMRWLQRAGVDDLVKEHISSLEERLRNALQEMRASDERYESFWKNEHGELAKNYRETRDKALRKVNDLIEELKPLQTLVDWRRQRRWWWIGLAALVLGLVNLVLTLSRALGKP